MRKKSTYNWHKIYRLWRWEAKGMMFWGIILGKCGRMRELQLCRKDKMSISRERSGDYS